MNAESSAYSINHKVITTNLIEYHHKSQKAFNELSYNYPIPIPRKLLLWLF